jgi:hypothetical protein
MSTEWVTDTDVPPPTLKKLGAMNRSWSSQSLDSRSSVGPVTDLPVDQPAESSHRAGAFRPPRRCCCG